LREKYENDPSTHPDFDPDLWMEVGSSGGRDKNKVYGLSNTTALRARTCGWPVVSQRLGAPNQYWAPNLRSSWPCSNTRFISLENTSDSQQIMKNSAKWSYTLDHIWVIHVRSFFGCLVPGTTNLLLLL